MEKLIFPIIVTDIIPKALHVYKLVCACSALCVVDVCPKSGTKSGSLMRRCKHFVLVSAWLTREGPLNVLQNVFGVMGCLLL